MGRTTREVQQDFAESSGYRREIIWDLLSERQEKILKRKIKELIPDQYIGEKKSEEKDDKPEKKSEEKEDKSEKKSEEKDDKPEKKSEEKDTKEKENKIKGQKRTEDLRENIFKSVWAQRKYTNRNSLTAIIYVLVTKPDERQVLDCKEFSCHPVIRTRKCIAEGDSSDCCMIFVDESGRVYQNWKSYIEDNELPEGIMVAPKRGIYTFDEKDNVELEWGDTPACSVLRKALKVGDITSATAGFGAAAIPIAAIFTTVAAPVMLGAGLVGLGAAAYSAVRSGSDLVDRSMHEQSINITDRQARNSWLGVCAGAIGLGASGATRVMTTAAAAGREISVVTQVVVNGMNISSIVLSGTGVANGVLDIVLKYQDDEDIKLLDLVQLSASLILFTHSVYNFSLASNLVNEAQNSTIKSYRDGLSNRQRRMFDKLSKETIRIRGEGRGKMDIIRNVNEIPSKQYLNDLHKINKNLNEQSARPAFGAAREGVVLNNEVPVDTAALRNSVQHNIGPDILGSVTQPIPASHAELGANSVNHRPSVRILFDGRNGQLQSNLTIGSGASPAITATGHAFALATIILPNDMRVRLIEFGKEFLDNIVNGESFENVLRAIAENFPERAFVYLMNLARKFIETRLEDLRTLIKMFITTESVLYRIFDYCMYHFKDHTCEFLQNFEDEILEAVSDYFNSLNPDNFQDLLTRCKSCSGFYRTCTL